MNPAYFSIVIPTRNRTRTLLSTVESCLRQSWPDYEVVVFDNCSDSPVADQLDRLGSPRVRCYRSEAPLAMSESWDRALSYASGEYVTLIGDDDGLLSFALEVAHQCIERLKPKALRWDWAFYRWPDSQPSSEANQLRIQPTSGLRVVDSREAIATVSHYRAWYGTLPMIYNSFVRREVLQALRPATGPLFRSLTPDIYSGFAIAHHAGQFASLGFPLGVAAVSAASNGEAHLRGPKDNAIFAAFSTLNTRAGLTWHPRIPSIPKSIAAVAAEAFEVARDQLFPPGYAAPTDLFHLAQAVVADLRFRATPSPEELDQSLATLRVSLRDHPKARRWLDDFCRSHTFAGTRARWTAGLHPDALYVDAANFGISNVAQAASFVESLLGKPDVTTGGAPTGPGGPPVAEARPSRFGLPALKALSRDLVPPILWRLARTLRGGSRAE